MAPGPIDTVGWQPEIRLTHQLRLVVYPIIYRVFSTIPGGCLGFLNHQQYHHQFISSDFILLVQTIYTCFSPASMASYGEIQTFFFPAVDLGVCDEIILKDNNISHEIWQRHPAILRFHSH